MTRRPSLSSRWSSVGCFPLWDVWETIGAGRGGAAFVCRPDAGRQPGSAAIDAVIKATEIHERVRIGARPSAARVGPYPRRSRSAPARRAPRRDSLQAPGTWLVGRWDRDELTTFRNGRTDVIVRNHYRGRPEVNADHSKWKQTRSVTKFRYLSVNSRNYVTSPAGRSRKSLLYAVISCRWVDFSPRGSLLAQAAPW